PRRASRPLTSAADAQRPSRSSNSGSADGFSGNLLLTCVCSSSARSIARRRLEAANGSGVARAHEAVQVSRSSRGELHTLRRAMPRFFQTRGSEYGIVLTPVEVHRLCQSGLIRAVEEKLSIVRQPARHPAVVQILQE